MKALVATVLSVCLGVAVLPASSDAARMTLFHGTIRVDYGQAYIASSHLPDFEESFFDCQTNGLAGAAVPGFIYLVNGLHTGNVRFRVELVGREPPVDHQWEDIVEVSFKPTGTEIRLVEWDQREYPLALPAALSTGSATAPWEWTRHFKARAAPTGRSSRTWSPSGRRRPPPIAS